MSRWLCIFLLASAACDHEKKSTADTDKPSGEVWLTPQKVGELNLDVEPVKDEAAGGAVRATGKIQFNDQSVSHIFSPVTGRITKLLVQPGDRVKKGAALATLLSPDLGAAFSDMAKAQADFVAAEHDFRRTKELYDLHAGSQKDYETSQDNFLKAKAELARTKEKARLFRQNGAGGDAVSQDFTLRAPIDGEVIMRNANLGAEVQGQYSGGTAVELFTIGELDHVWMIADIFESDLSRIKIGQSVQVRVTAYPQDIFSGKIEWISGALDPQSRTAKVRCSVPNPNHLLKPEMYGTVAISVDETKTLAVPSHAILMLGDTPVVFVQTGQLPNGQLQFERRPIATDEVDGSEFVPISHGLIRGDKVVVRNGEKLLELL